MENSHASPEQNGDDQDPFDDLLDLEERFYKEGYDAGFSDGQHAGLIEGKIFGIEKGFEKALEMGRLHGRGLTWTARRPQTLPEDTPVAAIESRRSDISLNAIASSLSPLPNNERLHRHIEVLLSTTDGTTVSVDNNDDAVAHFEEGVSKAKAKAKVITRILGEPLNVSKDEQIGIEETSGINARH